MPYDSDDEGKEPEGKDSEADEGKEDEQGILQRALTYCWSDDFLDQFRAYFKKHAGKFEDMARGQEEHELLHQELFLEYLGLFESSLEDFIDKEGSTPQEFYRAIRDNQDNRDPHVRLFIKCLLASADYDSFFKVMKKEAAQLVQQADDLDLPSHK